MRIIFHIDANSAYLSWSAASMLEKGYPIDIREIPSVISGDPMSRHGIILAKSIPAKKFGISTGESLFQAKQKCPNLAVFKPDYDLYMLCSNAMYEILLDYSPLVERYSIDECFVDFTESVKIFGAPIFLAEIIKQRIKDELGFTVNIGISSNKILAKMGSELKKPDKVHTMWLDEIEEKMWPLETGELFMVGRATSQKLNKINIKTIGDIAKSDTSHMKALLNSHGNLIWAYANGIDYSQVKLNSQIIQKGMGNSTTISYDLSDKREIFMTILALVERVCMRLRKMGYFASLVSISIKTNIFISYTHQLQLPVSINTTGEIYDYACLLFEECWRGEPIRHIGVSVSNFTGKDERQLSLFDKKDIYKLQRLDKAVDSIRQKYGTRSIFMGSFANGKINPVQGGTNDSDFIMMGGYKQ